jgi:uncharacterized membrane protein YphA (DoxX/SURF4 family)
MDNLKSISLYVGIGLLIAWTSDWLQSEFISKFLAEDLITLLIALAAINTTTLSVVLTKMRDIVDKCGADFARTTKEMKKSIIEQVLLVIFAIIFQIIGTSLLIINTLPILTFISEVALVAILANALDILYDTAKSVFIIVEYENTNSGKNHE